MRSGLIGGLACAAILTAGLVFSACGSSDDNSTSTTAISKAEFIKKASAICVTGNGHIGRVVEAFQKADQRALPTNAGIAKLGKDTVIPTMQRELDQIRALGAPSGQEDKIKALLDEEQSALDKVKAEPSLFASQGKKDPFASKLAQDYGLSLCGRGV